MLPNIAHNALLSGEVEYHGVADSALRLAAKGAPLKSIFFSARLPNYFLMAKPTIKSVSELRGKLVAVSRFGGTTDLAARVALQANGLDPQKDVVLDHDRPGQHAQRRAHGRLGGRQHRQPAGQFHAQTKRLSRIAVSRRRHRVSQQRLYHHRAPAGREPRSGETPAARVLPRPAVCPRQPRRDRSRSSSANGSSTRRWRATPINRS